MYLITEYLRFSLRMIVTQVLEKYMIIWYLDLQDIVDCNKLRDLGILSCHDSPGKYLRSCRIFHRRVGLRDPKNYRGYGYMLEQHMINLPDSGFRIYLKFMGLSYRS